MPFPTWIVLLCSALVVSAANAADDKNEYFWPAFHETLAFKAKTFSTRGSLTMTAGDEVTIAGKVWREVRVSTKRLSQKNEVFYIRADQSGLFTRYSLEPGAAEELTLKLPVVAGATWKTVDRDGAPDERRIDAIGECEVAGGKFARCVRVSFRSQDLPAVAFFAPEYGEVINSRSNGFNHRSLKLP